MTPKSPFILKNCHCGSHPATLTFQKHVALTQLSVTLVPTRRQQNLGCCPKIQPACSVGIVRSSLLYLTPCRGRICCARIHRLSPRKEVQNRSRANNVFFFILIIIIILFLNSHSLAACRTPRFASAHGAVFGFGDESDVLRAARHLLLLPPG